MTLLPFLRESRRPVAGRAALLLLPALALAFAGGCDRQAAAPSAVSQDFTHVRSLAGIEEYRLESNGLSVLLVPDHSAPVVTFNVTYRVGSRNEVTGTTGATHLLEHLMFKGSDAHNRKDGTSLDQYLERVGSQYNATTSLDRTNYYATVGRDDLEGYIAIEGDRMRNLWLHEADRQAEMTVVRNEFERGKNNPDSVLYEEVVAAAYQALPYHHSTIGWRSDIENVPIEKLKAFYDTFYWPNNATVTVVGDFESDAVLAMIRRHFGGFPASPQAIPKVYTEEPAQSGPRRVTVKRPGQLGTVLLAYKTVPGAHVDQPALAVLAAILSSGKNARLTRALVDTGLALDAGASADQQHDLSLFMLSASLAPGAGHQQVEDALLRELARVGAEGVTAEEVARVQRKYKASEAYRRDGTAGVAGALNEWIAMGDWTQYVAFPQAVAKVTPADVQRVAQTYFDHDGSTTGWFVPVEVQ